MFNGKVDDNPKKNTTDLLIDTNLAKARDMAYISPEAWRKYLSNVRDLNSIYKWKIQCDKLLMKYDIS